MKTGTILLLGLGGYALWYFAGLGQAGADLQVIFKGFQALSLTNYQLTFTLQNVTNATIQVNSIAADVQINGNDLGNVSTFTQVTLGPNSQTDINVNLNLSLITLPSIVQNIITQSGTSYNVTVDGNMNVNGVVLPLHVQNKVTF